MRQLIQSLSVGGVRALSPGRFKIVVDDARIESGPPRATSASLSG
jgi:hypothetical protein